MTTIRLKYLTDTYSVVLYILQLAIAQVLPRNFVPDSDGESPGSSFLEELPEEHGGILGLHAPLLPLSRWSGTESGRQQCRQGSAFLCITGTAVKIESHCRTETLCTENSPLFCF
jgi:hypothetical protein